MASTNGSAIAATHAANPPAKKTITRSEAYALVRSKAANLFANARGEQVLERQNFEQHYGSVTDLDEGFVRDMKALMLRASALSIANGTRKSEYSGGDIVPVRALQSVASTLAKAIAEVELYLAQRRATSLFAPPREDDYLSRNTYQQNIADPTTWVGDKVRLLVQDMLADYIIVDDKKPAQSAVDLQRIFSDECLHAEVLPFENEEAEDNPGGGKCARCLTEMVKVVVNGGDETLWIKQSIQTSLWSLIETEDSDGFDEARNVYNVRLTPDVSLASLIAMTESERRKAVQAIAAALEAEGDDPDQEQAKPKRGGRKKSAAR